MEQNRKENLFVQMCRRHQKEFNEFPLVFAFSKEEALEKLGLTHEESDVVSCFSNTGSYFKKSDEPAFYAMLDRHQKEREDAIQSDQSGNGFIFSMFSYVLESQEFAYTYDIEDTLNFLGYTIEEVLNSKALLNGLNKALKKYGVALKK